MVTSVRDTPRKQYNLEERDRIRYAAMRLNALVLSAVPAERLETAQRKYLRDTGDMLRSMRPGSDVDTSPILSTTAAILHTKIRDVDSLHLSGGERSEFKRLRELTGNLSSFSPVVRFREDPATGAGEPTISVPMHMMAVVEAADEILGFGDLLSNALKLPSPLEMGCGQRSARLNALFSKMDSQSRGENLIHDELAIGPPKPAMPGRKYADIPPDLGEIHYGRVETDEQEFYRHMLVTGAYVIADSDGEMVEVSQFLEELRKKDSDNPDIPSDAELYRAKTVRTLSALGERAGEQTDIMVPVKAGPVAVPSSLRHRIDGVSFLRADGSEIASDSEVTSSVFGTATTRPPTMLCR